MPEKKNAGQEKLEKARSLIAEAFVQVYSLYGLPDVLGRIYGVLFFADHPLGLDEIAGELGVSKATISVNIRILEGVGSVRKVWLKGSRRDYYEAERDFTRVLTEAIKNKLEKEVEITSAALSKSKKLLTELKEVPDERLSRKAKFFYQNIENLEKQYEQSNRILSAIIEAVASSE